MNSVYESLRALLRSKELQIKKLEKEIEALRVVMPIVAAESGQPVPEGEATAAAARPGVEGVTKSKPFGSDFENVLTQAAMSPTGTDRNIPAPDLTPKPRSNWP